MAGPPAPPDERTLARAAFGTGVASLVLAVVSIPLHPHPHSFGDHPRGLLEEVAQHDRLWLAVHAGIAGTDLLGTASLLFLALLMLSSPASRAAQLALATAIATASLLIVFLAVDGIATREAALSWASAAPRDRAGEYGAAAATVRVGDGLEMLGQILFFGVTIALFGAAVVRSRMYGRAVGWTGVALGSFAFLAGAFRAATGTRLLTVALFGLSGALASAWVVAAGAAAWRRSGGAT